MQTILLPGDPPIQITMRRSARARRYSLRVSQLDGRVTLTVPHGAPEAEGLSFARAKAGWIRAQLAAQAPTRAVALGGGVPFEGGHLPIRAGQVRGARLTGGVLYVPDDPAQAAARVRAFLKTQARERLVQASDHYAARLGKPYGRITLRDTRSRWGSCSSRGDLMYSWRLIMAPPEVLAYVAAHEVAHLAEMNHSPAFWAQVERLFPDHAAPRRWLRDNGADLHRVHFGD